MLTSSRTLAVEVLRWAERQHSPVPRCESLCRYCQSDVEDEAHVLLYCDGSDELELLRSQYFLKVFGLASRPFSSSLHSASSGLDIIRLLLEADNTDILCSFTNTIFTPETTSNCRGPKMNTNTKGLRESLALHLL
ncbi:hypothetical protein DFS33DRAFT_1331259, partial [Desarmillaria ectypa]